MKKLITSAILLSTLTVTSMPTYALTNQAQVIKEATVETKAKITFKDMKGSEWYYADVMNLVNKGIIGGYPNGTFGPSKTITFAEFLTISLKSVEKDIQGSPTDSHWAMGVYNTAIDKGIIMPQEFGKNLSDLNAPISREDMALILIRLNELVQKESKADTSTTRAKVPDFIKISKDRQDYVLQAYQKGLIGGKGSGFDPKGKATRAEASIVVLRLIDVNKRGNIEDIVVGPSDAYGRTIRTTNLPKNADFFPYIVEGVPNWAYEQQPFDDNYWGPSVNTLAPKGASKTAYLPKHVYGPEGSAVSNVMGNHYNQLNEFMEQYLNVDYRTIDKDKYVKVLTDMTDIRTTSFKSQAEMSKNFENYVNYVIKNKVVIKSEFEILPETAWVTVGDQIGVMNFSVYTKMLPTSIENGKAFDMPGSVQVYTTDTKKSNIKKGQELEGIVTFTLLRVDQGEWKLHFSSSKPLAVLDPSIDLTNGVAPGKKSSKREEKFNYTWTKDEKVKYTRYDRNVKSGNIYD